MTSFDTRLLTPPTEEEEIYPYRRAWRSVALENAILFVVVVVIFILFGFMDAPLLPGLRPFIGLLLAVLPVILWLIFSWWAESFVPQPRARLLGVMLTTALVASALGIPLVDEFFRVNDWLPLSSAVNRIVGYTFTAGIVQEMLKYLVLRYLVWPDYFRNRWDGIAYAVTGAVGYATVLNLHYVISSSPAPDTAALRIFDTIAVQTVCSVIVGFGLSELRFSRPSPLLPAITIALAAFVTGEALPLRAGLVNAGLALGVSATAPLRGLGFSVGLLVMLCFIMAFLFNTAERQEQETLAALEG